MKKLLILPVLLMCAIISAHAQTNLNFTAISATPEHTIQISWNSTSNETYEIDEADALGTNADGSTAWNELYTEYPSQGTNTFWLDTGNYVAIPPIVNPKYSPARYYRIVDLGLDTTSDEPVVTITGITNNTVVSDSLTVTVSAMTDQQDLSTLLFVDGQEMGLPTTNTGSVSGGTNYVNSTFVINTCEWLNGPHVLFATARCTSTTEGPHDNGPMYVGHAVSPMVALAFSNLVTGIAFTQPFFDPSLGQTQEVTAVFAANVNWTLQIQDVNTNSVRTVTGSGSSMLFDWDGTGDGGTNLPVGLYTYLITAETNGSPLGAIEGDSGGGGAGGPPSPEISGGSTAADDILWAQPAGGAGVAVPLVIFPPGFDTNGYDIFEEPSTWSSTTTSSAASRSTVTVAGGASFAPAYSGGSSQSSRAPTRPPTAPVRGTAGTFAVGYQTYAGNAPNSISVPSVPNGIGGLIQMEGTSANVPLKFGPLPTVAQQAELFQAAMKQGGWSPSFIDANDALTTGTITGAGSPFNQVDIGLLILHGTYGSAPDYTVGGCKQMYFPIASGGSGQYVRMSDMNFGGTATNGLKWLAIAACNSLRSANWNSMQSANVTPFNSNFHLLMGGNSVTYMDSFIDELWAREMLGLSTPSPTAIKAAWYDSARVAYGSHSFTNNISLSTAGDMNCTGDTLQTYSSPTGSKFYETVQIWP